MKSLLAAVVAMSAVLLVHFLNEKIIGDRSRWTGKWLQPRGTLTSGFPIVPTDTSQVERKNPRRWLWALLDLLVFVVLAIWWLAQIR